MKWLDALKAIAPLVLSSIPETRQYVPLIIRGIEVAEGTKAPGKEKKAIAKEIVDLGARVTNEVTKKEVIDPVRAVLIADQSIDLVIEATNKLAGSKP
jgi:hypothetical protein